MPYYCLFSRDLHILHGRWRSSLCSLLFVEITAMRTTFCGDYPNAYYFLWRLPLCAPLFVEITSMHTTFCGDYPYAHHFLWRLPLCTPLFVEITLMHTTFCGSYPYAHHFLWRLPLCTPLFVEVTPMHTTVLVILSCLCAFSLSICLSITYDMAQYQYHRCVEHSFTFNINNLIQRQISEII